MIYRELIRISLLLNHNILIRVFIECLEIHIEEVIKYPVRFLMQNAKRFMKVFTRFHQKLANTILMVYFNITKESFQYYRRKKIDNLIIMKHHTSTISVNL